MSTGSKPNTVGGGYADVWTRDAELDSLQLSIHDGKPLDSLHERANAYRRDMFQRFFPDASPKYGNRVLEVGSGVGWIMQAIVEAYPGLSEVVGLDISDNMIRRAKERWTHPRTRWVLYDARHFPFPNDSFEVIYSCAALQHVEKHHAFFIFKEIHRVLAAGGHAVLHLMPTQMLSRNPMSFEEECRNHVENRTDTHWHHYYSFDVLVEILGHVIGVEDLEFQLDEQLISLYVHFSKGTGRPFLRGHLTDPSDPSLLAASLSESNAQIAELSRRLAEIESSGAWRMAKALRSGVRRVAPPGSRRGTVATAVSRRLIT